MKRLLLSLVLLAISVAGASAACVSPAVMHDFPGTPFNMSLSTNADGNCQSNVGLASGSVVSGAFSAGAYAAGALAGGAAVDGWDLTQGAKADAACGTASGTCSIVSLLKYLNTAASAGTGATGSAVPTNGVYIALNVGGSLTGATGTANGMKVDIGSGVGTVAATQSGTWTMQPGNTPNTTPWLVTQSAGTSGGVTPYTPFVPGATDNHQTVKNGAGTAYWMAVSNNSATKNYARLYDAGTGFNGCNSATGVIFAFEIPPSDSGFTVTLGGVNGLAFSTGLSLCITSGFGLTDTTAATASAMLVNIGYK